jgi:peptidoglycan/xylan/chitin deacetylase (PgdA/CDA1 family)
LSILIPVIFEGRLIRLENILELNIKENYTIALSFDDGYKSDLTVVLPLLEEQKIPAIFFPIVERIGESDRLTWEDIKTISNQGFEIGSHGLSHTNLTELSLNELESELKESKNTIEQKINTKVKHFAVPYGRYNNRIIALAKSLDYKSILTTGLKCNSIDQESFVLYRWNITSDLNINKLRRVLQSNGMLPIKFRIVFHIKSIAKVILGSKIAEQINRKYTHE